MPPSKRATDPPRAPLAPDPARRRLSPREEAVARLVADGLDNDTIARRLSIAPSAVASYVQRIRMRLGLASRRDIAAWVDDRRDPDHPEAGLRRAEEA